MLRNLHTRNQNHMSNTASTFLPYLEDREKISSHMQNIFVNILIMFIKRKRQKMERKDVVDLILTNKNSFNPAFREDDWISKERWDKSTCHIPLIHQIHRRSHRHGHRRTAVGRTLCCYSEMSCHHKCCWVLKQENKWVYQAMYAFSDHFK